MSFKTIMRHMCLCLLVGSAMGAVAQNPFVGKWKFNPDKSQLTGDVIRFAPASGGAMEYSANGRSYKFKTDGNPYTTATGAKVTWKQVDDHTWQSSGERNGTPLGINTWTISPDGGMLTVEDKGTTPSGEAFDDTSTYAREGNGMGLMGSWRSIKTKVNEATTLEIQPSGDDGMTWSFPSMKATATVKMDGKDYPAQGPTVPDGLTLAVTSTGPHSLHMVEKMKGEPLSYTDYTVSDDGMTLTDVSTPAKVHEPTTEVWEKQ
jgi:hypothetical protein